MSSRLSRCKWPNLEAKYDAGLRAAVAFIDRSFSPVGIVFSGTILRGTPDPSSDLDIYVIHQSPVRQRIQKFFEGIPAEIFVNPPERIERYFEEELESGRPITAHMLATGFVVFDADPVVEELRLKARHVLSQAPTTKAESLEMMRYTAASAFEDAIDVKDRDPATASMLLTVCIIRMLHHVFRERREFLPREKDLIASIRRLDPELASWAIDFYNTSDLGQRIELAGRIADRTIRTRGFYEWSSEPKG